MLDGIRIRNFKSIDDLSIDLGRFNVLIGENGCGKSNILEGVVFAAAGVSHNVENEFLSARGARASDPQLMRSGFTENNSIQDILISLKTSNKTIDITFQNDNLPFSKWKTSLVASDKALNLNLSESNDKKASIIKFDLYSQLLQRFSSLEKNNAISENDIIDFHNQIEFLSTWFDPNTKNSGHSDISGFIIFSPEIYFLRNFSQQETYVEPLGTRGEGLLKLIKIIKKEKPEQYESIRENLLLIDWFDSFDVKEDASFGDTEFYITDKYLEDGLKSFDIRNANEGFLYLLFYITLFTSDYTPSFFAIDNIDTALNPKLCSKLITILSQLAVKHNKQVIITTHNPSVLDGLNLNDENERLFVIARNANGHTRAKRVEKKTPLEGEQSVKLSEQFMRGYIGGLPKNF